MKVLIALILLQLAATCFAAEGSLKVYECKTEADAIACNNKCKLSGETFDVKVNVNNNVVLISGYAEGKLHATYSLDGCKVANEQNWVCEPESNNDFYLGIRKEERMSDGIMHKIFIYKSENGGGYNSFTCAKKAGLLRYFGF